MGLKVKRQPLVESQDTDVVSRAPRFTRTVILSKSAGDTGLGHLVVVTFTASDAAHTQPGATLQWFGGERQPITFGLDGDAFAAFVDEANEWLEQHPVKATATP